MPDPRHLLVTGAAGFIGANFVHHWCRQYPADRLVVLDLLTYAGNPQNLQGCPVRFVQGDICDQALVVELLAAEAITGVVHFAAESHVDRSIHGPSAFIQTNLVGTFTLLEAFRHHWLAQGKPATSRFLHVSTDEVYGSLGPQDPPFTESTPYAPNSPYSASKAGSDHLVRSYYHTYGLPTLTTNCSNNYGPYHFPEKLIPLLCVRILQGLPLPVYGDGQNVRDWLYVEDHCRAIDVVLHRGRPGETYNIGGNAEVKNLDLVHIICDLMDELAPDLPVRPSRQLIQFVPDRPGHDRRYAIDATKIRTNLGWAPTFTLQEGLRRTIQWYLDHRDWWEPLLHPPFTPPPLPPLPADQGGFLERHLGPRLPEVQDMLQTLGLASLGDLIDKTIPAAIRQRTPLTLGPGISEAQVVSQLRQLATQNQVYRSFIGLGYANCRVPLVIQRNVLENPGWYTQYTPYQAEISQGRLEALLNFQTLVVELTGMEIANASLLDEATAAAEAMLMIYALQEGARHTFWVAANCHPQTIAVVQTRAEPLGICVVVGETPAFDQDLFGLLLQYPATDGAVYDYQAWGEQAHSQGALVVVSADLLSLTLLKPPGEFGADVVVGTSQRLGVPLGYGGPHAAYFATRSLYRRHLPGRLVGVSKDRRGQRALRLALQTREQHIRRDKATSNICTAQVLLAVMTSFYAVYHGPQGLKAIALRVHQLTTLLAQGLKALGYDLGSQPFFDTLRVQTGPRTAQIYQRALGAQINLRQIDSQTLGVSLDETTELTDIQDLWRVFAVTAGADWPALELQTSLPASLLRTSPYLTQPVFNSYHSETELLRYIQRLQARDLSLVDGMIPLGSCTMKLNATAEMVALSWSEFNQIHPYAPRGQTRGYQALFRDLEAWLGEITGLAAVSLQPNAGSQGEYTGLLVIRAYHQSRGQAQRSVCLIPQSAHGTNPASAVMAGMRVVAVACDAQGNIDYQDLQAKVLEHHQHLAALMITYPSTHGVFEEGIQEVCALVHAHGGQVYLDGANLNALVGLCRPADLGADVCHVNLHKTFCIPHGGGGPGMGPIAVAAHLAPFLPGHPFGPPAPAQAIGPVAAAPWGSSSILPISWAYIALMGGAGLTKATETAILNANYLAHRLAPHYPVLYRGSQGLVAHECILDLRQFKKTADVEVEDIAKRLMDYGFHAPTVSWPVAGTMMVEPTESEAKAELDRFCTAMIAIREEIRAIETGVMDRQNNPLKRAPHTAADLADPDWNRPYSREVAVFPAPWTKDHKFWPAVNRVDNAYGDRNLFCTCGG